MKIYSQNICWTKNKQAREKIALFIKKSQPDFVCLQEVVFGYQTNSFLLPNYYQYYHKKLKTINKGGLVILSKQKALSSKFVKFLAQGKINSLQLAERIISKGFLVVEFENIIVINTHLVASHIKSNRDKDRNNLRQLKQLLEFIDKQKKPVILAGDLNFSPKAIHYSILTKKLIDQATNIPITFEKYATRLDYICTTWKSLANCQLVCFEPPMPSDHFGLILDYNNSKIATTGQ
jgi:endonuclease/exonuclease/phosphatase family metal-dependent hydrolase